jgi:hypothetical protein
MKNSLRVIASSDQNSESCLSLYCAYSAVL